MKRKKTISIVLTVWLSLVVGCASNGKNQDLSIPADRVVTADIQAGIEKHIETQTRLGDGYFKIPFEGKELQLKLVRVHTEYLASLGNGRHFACVDLASIDGNVYDVDFFLEGDANDMTVTETTVHKINGKPLYAWKQRSDKTWHRVPVKDAPPALLGVIKDKDEFEFTYRVALPQLEAKARMWIPMPTPDSFQSIEILKIQAPGQQKILKDNEHGNSILFLELEPKASSEVVELRYYVKRIEKNVYEEKITSPDKYLDSERLVPVNEKFRDIAEEIVEGKEGDLERARALYDHVIDKMHYIKHGTGWGQGDAVHACDSRIGNCTDFHSYFIALCRSAGIPARFAIGASIPSARDSGGISGYHCWAEFYSDGWWWPVDISEADKCSSLSSYYFGHHPANRIELSRGRDLVVEPGPVSGPINFLAYPVLEINGKPAYVKPKLFFKRKTSG
jgi:transglutaminase-like putative cysteine protease